MCIPDIAAVLLLFLAPVNGLPSDPLSVASPDGELVVTFDLCEWEGESGVPVWSLSRREEVLISPSRLGFTLEDTTLGAATLDPLALGRRLEMIASRTGSRDSSWRPVHGERSVVRDHFGSLTVELRCAEPAPLRFALEFRAYDGGVAFCYSVPEQDGLEPLRFERECTEFRFTADHRAWPVYSAQGKYVETTLSKVESGCERPLVLQVEDGPYLAVGEARLVDFARMKLAPLGGVTDGLVAELSGKAVCALPFRSPWRLVMVADTPGELLEGNDLFLNLNDPCAIEDTSWIRPGKVLREVTLTTEGGRACVDFAAANGIEYVEFDAGWYGHEYDEASDATTVSVDPKRSPGPLDLPQVIGYAEERGVGILLYVNRRSLEKQLDEVLPLLAEWGVKGVKYGFVNVGSQRWTTWLHEAVRKAAKYELMVDVHDEYRPTGYSRTYPNLMTQEGIAGDETSPSNELTLTILFTRMLCGAGDNTICYHDGRVTKNAGHAYQLAKAICLYSPWQFVYWYDRPQGSPGAKGGAGGQKNVIEEGPHLEFFKHLPTVWDETRVLEGEIGEVAAIARRTGSEWYVGFMKGASERDFATAHEFLEEGVTYDATIYQDISGVWGHSARLSYRGQVQRGEEHSFKVVPRGGVAMRLVPRLDIFVSPEGDDANEGTLEAPLKTLEGARDRVRAEAFDGNVVVTLLEGRYFRSETFELDARDSATPGHMITWGALQGAEVILDGGLVVPGSSCVKVTDEAVARRLLPEARERVVQLDLEALGVTEYGTYGPRGFARPTLTAPVELFVDGAPLTIARWPNFGEPRIPLGEVLDVGSVPRHGDDSNRGGVFRYVTERAKRWTEAEDLHVSGIFTWGFADDTVKIAKIDTEAGTFTTVQPHRYGFGNSHQQSLWEWHAVNLLEEIDLPGEYYLDRESGIVYLLPPDPDVPIGQSTIQISLLEATMVSMKGVSRVRWEGITFENARGTGFRIDGGEEDRIVGCSFHNLGGLAVRASGERHGVLSCDVEGAGAGGIAVSGGNRRTLAPGGCFVRNCDISRVNRWYSTYRPCVSLSGVGHRIEHCVLHDCPGQGVLLSGNDHVIEYTEFGHLVSEMSDQGAIYMGRNPSHAGNVFRYNFFHHTESSHVGGYGNSGIFFDDGDSGQLVHGNVFYRCGANGAVKYHGGQFNSFVNNLVIDCPLAVKQQLWTQERWDEFLAGEQQQKQLLKQIDVRKEPYLSCYPRLARIFETPYSLERQHEECNYLTTAEDPLFEDGSSMDFSIRDLAKLRELVPGFEPIPFARIGTYEDAYRR